MEDLSEAFTWYADWAEGISSLYERLTRETAEDQTLCDIASEAPSDQPPPQLFLAAVHALLLRGSEHRLAAFYPTCSDDPVDPATRDPFPAFREFCLANEARIREIVSSRRVQTNAVGRSAILFPAFQHVVTAGAQPPWHSLKSGLAPDSIFTGTVFNTSMKAMERTVILTHQYRLNQVCRGILIPPCHTRFPMSGTVLV